MTPYHSLSHTNSYIMARVDHEEISAIAKRKKAYEDLKEGLREGAMLTDAFGGTAVMRPTNHKAAYEYLCDQEQSIKGLQKELGKYRAFFAMLRDFMPPQRSIHDKIG